MNTSSNYTVVPIHGYHTMSETIQYNIQCFATYRNPSVQYPLYQAARVLGHELNFKSAINSDYFDQKLLLQHTLTYNRSSFTSYGNGVNNRCPSSKRNPCHGPILLCMIVGVNNSDQCPIYPPPIHVHAAAASYNFAS